MMISNGVIIRPVTSVKVFSRWYCSGARQASLPCWLKNGCVHIADLPFRRSFRKVIEQDCLANWLLGYSAMPLGFDA